MDNFTHAAEVYRKGLASLKEAREVHDHQKSMVSGLMSTPMHERRHDYADVLAEATRQREHAKSRYEEASKALEVLQSGTSLPLPKGKEQRVEGLDLSKVKVKDPTSVDQARLKLTACLKGRSNIHLTFFIRKAN